MERQYKKNSKGLVVLLSIIIVVLVGALGYFVYDSYFKDSKGTGNKGNVLSKTNYYSADYLLSNNFITEAYTYSVDKAVCGPDVKYGLYKDDNGYYIQYCDSSFSSLKLSKVFDLSVNDKIYYNTYLVGEGGYLFYDIMRLDSNNNLYYSYYGLSDGGYSTVKTITDKKEYKDYKIENVKNVYRLTSDKSDRWYHPIAVLEMTNGDMKILMEKDKRIFKNEEEGITLVDLKDVYPYFDYICAFNSPVCNDTMFYITFDKKMVPSYNLSKPVVDESGKEIKVKDAFATFDTKGLSASGASLFYPDFDEGYPSYDFVYTIYILDENNVLYKLELNKDAIDNKKEVSAIVYKKDVSSLDVVYNEGGYWASEFIINYTNNSKDSVKLEDMRSCSSTMYDRNLK